jgi:hypothetical protein
MESQNSLEPLARQSISLRSDVEEIERQMSELEARLRLARSASQNKDKYVILLCIIPVH